jgi:hypothetical protein
MFDSLKSLINFAKQGISIVDEKKLTVNTICAYLTNHECAEVSTIEFFIKRNNCFTLCNEDSLIMSNFKRSLTV